MTSEIISEWLQQHNLGAGAAGILGLLGAGIYLFILALLANFVTKRFIAYVIHPIIGKTSIEWDDLLIEHIDCISNTKASDKFKFKFQNQSYSPTITLSVITGDPSLIILRIYTPCGRSTL